MYPNCLACASNTKFIQKKKKSISFNFFYEHPTQLFIQVALKKIAEQGNKSNGIWLNNDWQYDSLFASCLQKFIQSLFSSWIPRNKLFSHTHKENENIECEGTKS